MCSEFAYSYGYIIEKVLSSFKEKPYTYIYA